MERKKNGIDNRYSGEKISQKQVIPVLPAPRGKVMTVTETNHKLAKHETAPPTRKYCIQHTSTQICLPLFGTIKGTSSQSTITCMTSEFYNRLLLLMVVSFKTDKH